jgi:hypothetical protein
VRSRSDPASGAGEVTSPRNARRTRPSLISAAMMPLVVPFTGTARPTPTPATAVLTPTTRARESASAPPELPGFSAASVWITSSISRTAEPLRAGSDRPSPDTTPAVTDPASPSGLPTATTSWPTTRSSLSPSRAGSGVGTCDLITARSDSGSRPTTVKAPEEPSANASVPDLAEPITCAFVSRNPSAVNTTADPLPRPARTPATLGCSSAATEETICE